MALIRGGIKFFELDKALIREDTTRTVTLMIIYIFKFKMMNLSKLVVNLFYSF